MSNHDGWIYSHKYGRYYRQELVNGDWVETWDGRVSATAPQQAPAPSSRHDRIGSGIYAQPSRELNHNPFEPRHSTSSEQHNFSSPAYGTPPSVEQHTSNYKTASNTVSGAQYPFNQYPVGLLSSTFPSNDLPSETGPAHESRPSSYQNAEIPYAEDCTSTENYVIPRGEGDAIQGTWRGSAGQLHYEKLDYSYFVRDRSFFVQGRVFSVLFTEAAGSTASGYPNDCISLIKFGEKVYSQIRRFVVVKQRREYCYACPIFTYSGKATLKRGVRPTEHAVIHTSGCRPTLLEDETGIVKDPIAVETPLDQRPLHQASRIYFGIVHPIQYNVKVKDLGMVCQDNIPKVIGYYEEEQMNDIIPNMISSPNTSRV